MVSDVALDSLKALAAREALGYVKSGMQIGLGSGTTSSIFTRLLGNALQSGKLQGIKAVPTSNATADQASRLGIPLISLSEVNMLDLAVDGADEVDPDLNLIKGLGKAALREKIVEIHARRFIVIVEESKLVQALGSLGPLPVEIIPFESEVHIRWLNTLGCNAELWHNEKGAPVVTDNGNFLVRCWFNPYITDPYKLADLLEKRPGIVEHGLFLDLASEVIVAGKNGVQILRRKK